MLCPKVEQKVHFFGAGKLHCLSLQNHFFPKLFGHSVNPGCSEIVWQMQISNLLWKSLWSDIFLKMYFFLKSDFIGHNSKLMKFCKQIYVIVLPKQQVLPQKNMVKIKFLVSMGCGRRLICQNIHCWKNYASCIFSKVIKKLEVKKNGKHAIKRFF